MEQNSFENMTKAELIAQIETLYLHLQELTSAKEERRMAVEALLEKEDEYRILLDESSDPIFTFYPDGTYRYINHAFADGVGKSMESILGKKIWDVFPKDEADKRFAAVKWVFENGQTRVLEVRVPRPDGDRHYITTVKPIFGQTGKVISVLCISKEITDRKQMEDELRNMSTHDAMTGLYNRNYFQIELERLQNSRLYPVSIVMADMDGLKLINDSQGHSAGDERICKTANLFRESFRSEDIIARIGGDEFVVLLPHTTQSEANEIVARLRISINSQTNPQLNISIGSATGETGQNLTEVMHLADEHMYQEKAEHKTPS
jgi:diguanylate cyclase (GGDEF)-like protein/PAS domain S-box-containing protein